MKRKFSYRKKEFKKGDEKYNDMKIFFKIVRNIWILYYSFVQ